MDNIKYSPGEDAALRYLAKKLKRKRSAGRLLEMIVGVIIGVSIAIYFGY